MGWASGWRLFVEVWAMVRERVRVRQRVDFCVELMRAFERRDCDTLPDAFREDWPEVEAAYYKLHPDYRDEAEDETP